MTWTQIVEPNLNASDKPGWCLRFIDKVYPGSRRGIPTAWKAWEATKLRHYDKDLPPVSVPVWFDHWGTYGGVYGRFGHVAAWVPGRGFVESGTRQGGEGQQWHKTIREIERYNNCTFVGWSEDMPDNIIVTYTPEEKVKMSSNQNAAMVRNYELDGKDGAVEIALIYPSGLAVKLNKTMDIEALCLAHISVYGLPVTNDKNTNWNTKYGAQLTTREFEAFFKHYPSEKKGF
jgi:hypothetical protein